jgi:hypothetical protein
MKKQSIIYSLLLLVISFSCQKDNEIKQQFTIEAAQSWFTEYSKPNESSVDEKAGRGVRRFFHIKNQEATILGKG